MKFSSRIEAGQLLGERLRAEGFEADLVLGLPRGGVVVAAEVARALKIPLAALVVRKIGHPHHRELAVGALAEPDVVVLDDATLRWSPTSEAELEAVRREEIERLQRYQELFHPDGPPELAGKSVWLVDDGLATGATMEAAVLAAQKRRATRVMVAVPVASTSAAARIRQNADALVTLLEDDEFGAVGRFYDVFKQVEDSEVVALLPNADTPDA